MQKDLHIILARNRGSESTALRVSCDQGIDDMTIDVGQSEVSASVAKGQFFVVEAEQMQNGRVHVVHMDAIVLSVIPKFVRRPVRESRLETRTGQPPSEAVRIVISSVLLLGRRRATKFAAPNHQRVFQQASLL